MRFENYRWAQELLNRLPSANELFVNRGGLLAHLPEFASTVVGAIADAAIVFVVGIYLASQPALYSSDPPQTTGMRQLRQRA